MGSLDVNNNFNNAKKSIDVYLEEVDPKKIGDNYMQASK